MNREIKFRAWGGRMIYDGHEMGMHGARIGHDTVWYYDEGGDVFYWRENDGDYFFMQFTGLHDKNGKEIYEGDILKHDSQSIIRNNNNGVYEVVFGIGAFYGKMINAENACDLVSFHFPHTEVIGNIYENPELVK